jgi:hypothetical protein
MAYTRAMNIQLKVMAALLLAGTAVAAQPATKAAEDQSTALDLCERIALAKVQGRVLERSAQKYPTGINYEYLIKAKDGRRLVVAVDGRTRKVFAVMDSEPAKVETGEEEAGAPSPE